MDGFFQRAFAKEPAPACRFCHAPEAASQSPKSADLAVGVGCAACHVRNGAVLAAPFAGADVPAAPHALLRTAAVESASFCAGCHEFGFLALPKNGHQRFESHNLQQSTWTEWLASAPGQQGTTCQNCHMPAITRPNGEAGRDHRMLGRQPEMLAGAAAVAVKLIQNQRKLRFQVEITAQHTGHALPTGDQFRRMDWLLFSPTGKLAAIVHLGRTWRVVQLRDAVEGLAVAKQLKEDQRIPPPGQGTRKFEIGVPGQPGTWRWQLQHVRAIGLPAAGLVACRHGDACVAMVIGEIEVK